MSARGKADFFAIDGDIWPVVVDCGLNPAVAYLVLATGTGRDNRITRWSASAVMKYAGIGWQRAKESIDALLDRKLIRSGTDWTPDKPQRELVTFKEFWDDEADGVSAADYKVLRELLLGNQPRDKDARNRAESLYRRALLRRGLQGLYSVPESVRSYSGPSWIWLPNSIVTGTSKGEDSPVNRLRAAGCPWTLRLFVDLYAAHNLRDNGGIGPRIVWQNFERMQIGEQGEYIVWAFKPGQYHVYWTGPIEAHYGRPKIADQDDAVFDSLNRMEKQGLLSFVPHIFENDTADAEPLHPYAVFADMDGIRKRLIGADPLEVEIGVTANAAAASMCLPSRLYEAWQSGFTLLCPIRKSLPQAQMVGIARLNYRPHTRRTSAWSSNLHKTAPELIRIFRELRERAEITAARREAKTG